MLVKVSRDMSKYPLADRGFSDEALIIKVLSRLRSLLSSVTSSLFLALVQISSTAPYPASTELVTANRFNPFAASWKMESHLFRSEALKTFCFLKDSLKHGAQMSLKEWVSKVPNLICALWMRSLELPDVESIPMLSIISIIFRVPWNSMKLKLHTKPDILSAYTGYEFGNT